MLNIRRFSIVAAFSITLLAAFTTPSNAATKLRLAGEHPVNHQPTIIVKEQIQHTESAGVDLEIKFSLQI